MNRQVLSRKRVVNQVVLILALLLLVALAVWLVLLPPEAHLGNIIKLVYVHGALTWVGLGTFSLAAIVALLALVTNQAWLHRGIDASSSAALAIWVAYAISAMIVTELTWGQLVAWNEPRVQATAMILVAAVVFRFLRHLVNEKRFGALVALIMGVLPWFLVNQAQALRHPVDPIGGSESTILQLLFKLTVVTIAGLAALLIFHLWLRPEAKAED